MPIGGSRRMGTGKFIDPKLMPMLKRSGDFPYLCALESQSITKSSYGDAVYTWNPVNGYEKISCDKYDRLPHDQRTLDIIEELKYWTIALSGYYPNIDSSWRVRILETNELFAIEGIDSDSRRFMTIITARQYIPSEEVG